MAKVSTEASFPATVANSTVSRIPNPKGTSCGRGGEAILVGSWCPTQFIENHHHNTPNNGDRMVLHMIPHVSEECCEDVKTIHEDLLYIHSHIFHWLRHQCRRHSSPTSPAHSLSPIHAPPAPALGPTLPIDDCAMALISSDNNQFPILPAPSPLGDTHAVSANDQLPAALSLVSNDDPEVPSLVSGGDDGDELPASSPEFGGNDNELPASMPRFDGGNGDELHALALVADGSDNDHGLGTGF
ncbi:hypothetical protein LOK49_LG03G02843 [Camellia lanceoleosa]|uniref:Uncharacterized protein n=1 Tax=Camellia lanceoleosa TaxID=1840588 RepID=A0ACC0ICH7_9ERIC|nr:hypothetical protein LOK49_LG03G02843 [Camellia lanceoleosa]